MARRPPQLGLGLDLDASASSLRTSMSTDLGASYNLTSEGVRLLSASQREFHLHAAGHETRTAADRVAAARSGTVAPETRAGSGSETKPGDEDRLPSRVSRESAVAPNGATGDMTIDVLPFDVIGAGAGGSVKRAIHVPSHTFIALKVMTVFDRERRKQLVNELRALADADADCAHIVGFVGAYYDKTRETVCVALEFADGGSLESALKRAGRAMPPVVVGGVCAQVAAGLEYLHEKKRLVHRDIKPGNVLVRRTGVCKITDFGIVAQSKMMDPDPLGEERSISTRASDETGGTHARTGVGSVNDTEPLSGFHSVALKSFKGSLRYMSPERVERSPYGRAADIWSLGMTLCECALGRYPFDEQDGGVLGLALKISQTSDEGEGILDRVLPRRFSSRFSSSPATTSRDDVDARTVPSTSSTSDSTTDMAVDDRMFGNETNDNDENDDWVQLRDGILRECVRRVPAHRPTAFALARAPFARRCLSLAETRADDPRYSLGAFVRGAADTSASRDAEAFAFLEHYARLRDAARRAFAFCDAAASSDAAPETRRSGALALERALALLAGLYRGGSCLTCASGRRARGAAAVARAVAEEGLERYVETTISVAALPGGVEGGALIVRSGLVRAERDESRAFVTSDTFLLLRVHEGWGGANGGGRFYVRNQVEKRVDVRAS